MFKELEDFIDEVDRTIGRMNEEKLFDKKDEVYKIEVDCSDLSSGGRDLLEEKDVVAVHLDDLKINEVKSEINEIDGIIDIDIVEDFLSGRQ